MLFLKNLVFTVIAPGTVTVLIPYTILSDGPSGLPESWTLLQYGALVPGGLGVAIYVWCVWDFATFGRGTPAPIDPPKRLVVHGLYRYVRNPMYVGVLLVVVSEAAFFASRVLLQYAVGLWLVFHLFVVLYEERALRRMFGESYERYRRSVGRWLPGRGYRPAD